MGIPVKLEDMLVHDRPLTARAGTASNRCKIVVSKCRSSVPPIRGRALPITPVIDADSHISEPPDVWTARVPSKYVDEVPRLIRSKEGVDVWTMGGRSLGTVGRNAVAGWPAFPPEVPKTIEDTLVSSYDSHARLQYMDEAGIWAQVLYPNVAGFGAQSFLASEDDELKLLCVRAYNDFLLDWCSADPERLIGVMALPFWSVEASVHEVERCAEPGDTRVLLPANRSAFGLPPLGAHTGILSTRSSKRRRCPSTSTSVVVRTR